MKKILITGANSYIGTSFEEYMNKFSNEYIVDTVDMVDNSWKNKSFSEYEAVFHVAGIAHQKETKQNAHLYYEVNRDLAIETANKAKNEGVGLFVFLSSMSIYGKNEGAITRNTEPSPTSNYGISKFQAEKGLLSLSNEEFRVCIIRPPMVYGKGCKGNFNTILKLVKKFSIFPKVNNIRSMIYVDNLSSFVKLVIEGSASGIFMPQNKEYVQTSHMADVLAKTFGRRIFLSRFLGACVLALKPFSKMAKKGFGSLVYKDTEDFDYSYCIVDNDESYELSANS